MTIRKTGQRKTSRVGNSVAEEAESLLAGYSEQKKPLGGYMALVGLLTLALGSGLASTASSEEDLPELGWSDLLLLGIATHKLSRIATKDLVTSPFRAPFVKFKKSAGAG